MLFGKNAEFINGNLTTTVQPNYTNVLDTLADSGAIGGTSGSNTSSDIGEGQDIELYVTVTTALNSGGTATFSLALVSSASSTMGTDTTHITILPVTTISSATIVPAGELFRGKLPSGTYLRYLALKYVIGTAVLTAGAMTANLALNTQRNVSYAPGFTVSGP